MPCVDEYKKSALVAKEKRMKKVADKPGKTINVIEHYERKNGSTQYLVEVDGVFRKYSSRNIPQYMEEAIRLYTESVKEELAELEEVRRYMELDEHDEDSEDEDDSVTGPPPPTLNKLDVFTEALVREDQRRIEDINRKMVEQREFDVRMEQLFFVDSRRQR